MTHSVPQIIKIPLPTPYPVGDVNTYFIDGPEPILIDTGVYSSKSLKALSDGLEAHGRKLTDIRRILITHDHYDHAGAALHLSQICPATLRLHEKGTLTLRREPETIARLRDFALRCGVPAEAVDRAFQAFAAGAHFGNLEAKPHKVEYIKGGEVIDAGDGLTLEIIPAPGHSPDGVAFFDPRGGELFCGDLLLPKITPNPSLHFDPRDNWRRTRPLVDYLDSLDRVARLPISVGHPGHGADIPDFRGLIARNKEFLADRKQCYAVQISVGPTNPYELARAVFGDLDVINQFLALSETVAYLDLLERDGEIEVDWGDKIIEVRSQA
jgi:glyoxylase-like metal-dependent hydrolase (beta-lactamase superfamily II)